MKKKFLCSAAKKAQIALAVMAVCGLSFAGADKAYAGTFNNDQIIIQGNEAASATGNNTTVIGAGASVTGNNTTAVGTSASATGNQSTAVGAGASAAGNQSTAVGASASATAKNSVAIGYGSVAGEANTVSVGNSNDSNVGTRRITNVAAGTNDNDAVNVKQINDTFDSKVGTTAQITSTNVISADNNVNQNLSAIDTAIGAYSNDVKNIDKDASVKANISTLDTEIGSDNDIESTNVISANSSIKSNLSSIDSTIGAYGTGTAYNIDTGNGTVKANISTLDNEIGSYDPNTTQNVISTDKDIKSNLSSIDKYMGDIKKIGTDDNYSIIDRNGNKVQGDTLNVADILNVIDDKVGDLNKENKYIVEDDNGAPVEIGSYNHIDGTTSLAENMEELDAAIGTTADGTYVSSKASVGENLNALDTQVAANTNAINRLDNKVNKVGAGAAALAALHPLDFDPDDKLTFAAGFGNYGGENAVALGAFYRPDEKVMFSVAGNMGNGENMINAGVSFALDRTHKSTPSKAVMAKKLAAQDEQLAALNNVVAAQSQEIAELKAMVKELSAKK